MPFWDFICFEDASRISKNSIYQSNIMHLLYW